MQENNLLRRLFANTSWLMFQNIYSMLLSLIVGSISARFLGPSNYGMLRYATAMITLCIAISKLGLDSIVINEIVLCQEKKSTYLGTALGLRIMASIICFLALNVIMYLMEPNSFLLRLVTICQSFEIILRIYEVFNYWFQAELKSKYFVISVCVALTITNIWRIGLLCARTGVILFSLSTSIQAAIILIMIYIVFRKYNSERIKFSIREAKYLLNKSRHYIVTDIAVTLYMQIDRIMLGKMTNEEMVGYYSAASTIASLWEFVPNAIINSMRPVIIAAQKNNYSQYIKRMKYLWCIITMLGAIVTVGILFFGKYVIYFLYGKEYMQATFPLYYLIIATCFAMIGTATSVWLLVEEKYKYNKYFTLIGCVLNIILNYWLINRLGIIGASIATCICQMYVAFIAPMCFKETRVFGKLYVGSFVEISQIASFLTANNLIHKRK